MEHLLQTKKDKEYAVWCDEASTKVIDVDLSKRTVTGLYNTAHYFDEDQDVILSGANNKSMIERGPKSSAVQKIKHLKDHDWGLIPAKLEVLEERKVYINNKALTGSYFEAKMSNSTLGNDLLISYQEGLYDNHSFGFRYVDGQYVEQGSQDWTKYVDLLVNPEDAEAVGYMFVWKELKMYEGSSVAFGANSLTPYLGVKSENKDLVALKVIERIGLIEKQLHNGTQSDDGMQAMEMQLLQLKQIVKELFINAAHDIKATLIEKEKGRTDDLQSTLIQSINDFKL